MHESSVLSNDLEIYRVATSYLTSLLKDRILEGRNTGDYAHLKNPNNRSRGVEELEQRKFKFRIFTRPPSPSIRGRRNLNLGSSEVLLFLHNGFFSSSNFLKGFSFHFPNARYRFVYCNGLACPELADSVDACFRDFFENGGKKMLEKGKYDSFVRESAGIVNDEIAVFKDIAREMDF